MNTTVEIFGSCFASADAIRNLVARNDLSALSNLEGHYSLAIRSGATVTLVGSAVGPSNLFYVSTNAGFFYAPSVVDLLKQARIPWRWHWTALADLTALEHCVDGETIHADIRKVKPGNVVRFDGRNLSSSQATWTDRVCSKEASPQGALDSLVASCLRHVAQDVVVSMSAGFDSRLLLACLLASGVKPRLITMGHSDSTDIRVSAAIARKFNLRFEMVPLDASAYMNFGQDIATVTGGTKSFLNWHTYAYAKNAPLTKESRIFIGSNGEAARSYYLDKGIASVAAQSVASEPVKSALWTRKMRPIFQDDELAMFDPNLAAQFAGTGFLARVQRLQSLSPGRLLSGLDHFYTEQRVSNFITNGLSLVNVHAQVAAPMLDRQWMSHIWNLPRSWKLNSKWHRFAIARLCPALLAFEEEATGKPMRGTSKSLYWLPVRRRQQPSVPYMDYQSLLRNDAIVEFAHGGRDGIKSLARPELVSLVFDRHRRGENRTRAASFLLTMLFLGRCLQSANIKTANN